MELFASTTGDAQVLTPIMLAIAIGLSPAPQGVFILSVVFAKIPD